MLFTFGGKLIKAEEIDIEEQKSLINKIISLHKYEGELEEEYQKIKEDKDRTALSTNKTIETTITVALEQVKNQIQKEQGLLKALNQKLIDAKYTYSNEYLGDKTYTWPVEGYGNVSQGFSAGHKGIDINTFTFYPRALNVQNGIVVFAGVEGDGYGNKVILYYGDNLFAVYAHLEKISVEQGAFILEGEEIGLVGNTGNSSGNHLHFELFHKEGNSNINIDPMDYLGK